MAVLMYLGMMVNMSLLDKLIAVVAPHNCLSCNTEGSLLCGQCVDVLGVKAPGRCFRCNKLSNDNKTCPTCRRNSNLNTVWIRTEYKGIAKELVHKLKFERSLAASEVIAKVMADTLPDTFDNSIIIPIPTASSRKRQRGYDQSVMIARHIAKLTNVPMHQYLIRLGQTRQVGSKKADRISQLQDAYIATHNNELIGKSILIIDDVMTTGATLESAAKILRGAGVKRVDALVFARA